MKRCCEDWLKGQFGDDGETIAAVYAEYAETMSSLLADVAAARAAGDAKALDVALHTIKGTAAMAGDAELSAVAEAARSLRSSAELDAAEAQLRAMAAEI